MGSVQDMVDKVERMGQPALALTDHGVMAGAIRLYKLCRKAGIEPFPGEEFYLVKSMEPEDRENRYHLGLLALDQRGFEGLVKLSSHSHTPDRFHRKPLVTFGDLSDFGQEYGDHVALTTGCYFGLPTQMLINAGFPEALRVVRWYASLFPHTFIELQNHNVEREDQSDREIVAHLAKIAHELGLPVVAGQDAHYCDRRAKFAHDMMKEISYHGVDGDDFKFPGDSYHLATAKWVRKHYDDETWLHVEEGHGHLLDLHKLKLPELDNYKFHVPSANELWSLERLAKLGLSKKHLDVVDTYEKRLAHELDVIKQMGFEEYFLLVRKITEWCRNEGIIINARGSVNGSLVAYALGITNVDPLQWDTSFHRFLSLDRQKPPDIDLDIESGRRADVIEYVRSLFPSAVQIGTYGRLGMQEDDEGNEKGSLFVQYKGAMTRRYKARGEVWDGRIDPEHADAMKLLTLLDVRRGPSTHAAGLVLPGDELPIEKYLATMLVGGKNGTTVTQAVMEDVEDAGYVKLDLLGVKALDTIGRCLSLIDKPRGELQWIKFDDRKAMTLLRSGKTMGVFQFEGPSTMRGARKMKVKSTLDCILCLALFRPAMMNSGMTDRYLACRESGKPQKVPQLLERLLDVTLGVPVFQEQVIDIMRAVDLPYEDLNEILKAVKASNDKINEYAAATFKKIGPKFRKLAVAKGMSLSEAKFAWQMVKDFKEYGFNRAHATAYGIMGYQAGYLKAHYPLEFMCATLDTWAGTPKERQYINEARRLKIPIVKADVNYSGVGWAIDRSRRTESLRRGLVTIKGVGHAAAKAIVDDREAHGVYTDLADLIERLPARPVSGGKEYAKTGELNGVLGKLRDAGALRSLEDQ